MFGVSSARSRRCAARPTIEVREERSQRQAQVSPRKSPREACLGPPRYRYGKAEEEEKVGVTTGLAWTDLGGELLAHRGARSCPARAS